MTGDQAEAIAANYLRAHKHKIIEQNYRIPSGEIDIISKDNGTLVFVEVKYLKSIKQYFPEEQVSPSKQRKLFKAAKSYLQVNKYDGECRFDVLAIHGEKDKLLFDHFIDALEFNF